MYHISFLNVVGDISQVVLAVAAVLALSTWNEQMKGGGKYNVAKNLLVGTRKMQEIIQNNVRNPGLQPSEINKERDQNNWQYLVYQKRLREMYDHKRENFDGYALEAEILLGNKIKEIVSEFDKKIDELKLSIYVGYGMLVGDENQDKETWKQAHEKINKNRELLWNTGLEEDKYSKELELIVTKMKQELNQHIQ